MFDESPMEAKRRAWRAAALAVYARTPAGRLACTQGFVVTPSQTRALGMLASEIRGLVRRGEWTNPRRGVLCVLPRRDSPVHGHCPEVAATSVALTRPDAAISHQCAALIHGADPLSAPVQASLTTNDRSQTYARHGAVIRAARIDAEDLTRWYGVRVLTCARSVVDIARDSAREGLVVADSALREELATIEDLGEVLSRQSGWVGTRTARHVHELASAKSESPLESLVRLFLADHHLPLPEQQVWIETHLGWVRVDGLWEETNTVLEVDGLLKYRRRPVALDAEKVRQEALERAGFVVVRITWNDIHLAPRTTLERVCATLGRQGLDVQHALTRIPLGFWSRGTAGKRLGVSGSW